MARKKKEEVKIDIGEIKKMESKIREKSIKEAAKVEKKPNLVSFEAWWHMRSKSIPAIHAKEIIMVDFKSRGLKDLETVEAFDKALIKYGIML